MLRLNNLLCVPQNKLVLCASSHSSHTKSPSSLKLCYKQLEFSTRKSLALPRMYAKCCASASAASSDVVTTGNSAFDHITVATTRESGSKELKEQHLIYPSSYCWKYLDNQEFTGKPLVK
uniref:Uncharacterized protein n=1 Tax=Kalanchoe fedtschenkoi TaxID=63787 RepID=A0A7N0ZVE0_KALFE